MTDLEALSQSARETTLVHLQQGGPDADAPRVPTTHKLTPAELQAWFRGYYEAEAIVDSKWKVMLKSVLKTCFAGVCLLLGILAIGSDNCELRLLAFSVIAVYLFVYRTEE